jgi:MFS family permease
MSRVALEIDAAPRGGFQLLRDPAFGAIFWGKVLANIGVWVHSVAAVIVMFQATGSSTAAGMVTVAQFGPQLVLAPLSGKWADRYDRVRQMILGRVLCAAGSGILGLLLLALSPTGATLACGVVASSVLVGLGFVVGGSAMYSIVPDMVRPEELGAAMTLNTVPVTVGRVLGPVFAAYAVGGLGAPVAFVGAALAHTCFVVLLVIAPVPRRTAVVTEVDSSVRAGLAYIRADRTLVLMIVATAAIAVVTEPILTLGPMLASQLGGGAEMVGSLTASFGVGASIGTLTANVAARLTSVGTSARLGLALLGVGVLTVVSGSVVLVHLGFVLAGVGLSWSMAGSSTLLQQSTAREFRGRVTSIWLAAFLGVRPLAAMLTGGLADVASLNVAFGVAALAALAAALGCRPKPAARSTRRRFERSRFPRSPPQHGRRAGAAKRGSARTRHR